MPFRMQEFSWKLGTFVSVFKGLGEFSISLRYDRSVRLMLLRKEPAPRDIWSKLRMECFQYTILKRS